ncbi:facilitated trehalose transporter Tret1-like [Choristoneura fumiferana]|uniref:facilitated trehalose transporter Tret1-like n=1 Tax=Choristoneura fumiferana TaxID=7141 RepID=UPI003D15CAE9
MDKPTIHMLSVQEKSGATRRTTQYIAAVAAAIGAVIAGTILAWTSPALPQLQPASPNATNIPAFVTIAGTNYTVVKELLPFIHFKGENGTNKTILVNSLLQPADFVLDTTQSSLVSSILAIGAAISALPVGVLAERVGRRPTILSLALPFLINWLLTIFANGAAMLIAARFFAGLATGGICVAAPMYIGEIAETSIRGSLGAFFQLFLTVGILFTFVIGGWTHWRVLSIISAVLPPLLVAVFWWMPETPQYLLGKNRRHDAERALRWLRGPDADLSAELEDMQKDVDTASRQRAGMLSMVTNRAPLMALVCSLGLMFFQQFSGINAVIFYTNNIFSAAGSNIDPVIATIIVGVVQTIATYISSLLVEKAGRRILLLQSCVIMGLCLIVLGVFFKMQESGSNVSALGWVPLVCLVLFIISFSLGFGPIPWMMMAELFAVEYRGSASGFAVIFNWCLVFIVTLCFPIMKEVIGIYSCFWFFAAFMVACIFFVFFLIPETKGKTVSQIQTILGGK